MPRRGADNGADKRNRILRSAIRIFSQKGFFNSKVSEIARAPGVADGTIYLYFKNKDDLLISLFEERMDGLLRGLRRALEGVEAGPGKLRAGVDHLVTFAMEKPELMEVFTVDLRQSTRFM